MIFCVLAAGKSCVAIPKLHNHVLAADSSSFSLSSKLLLISSTFVWAPEAKGRVNSTPAEEKDTSILTNHNTEKQALSIQQAS